MSNNRTRRQSDSRIDKVSAHECRGFCLSETHPKPGNFRIDGAFYKLKNRHGVGSSLSEQADNKPLSDFRIGLKSGMAGVVENKPLYLSEVRIGLKIKNPCHTGIILNTKGLSVRPRFSRIAAKKL
jgi:hypothetical protein